MIIIIINFTRYVRGSIAYITVPYGSLPWRKIFVLLVCKLMVFDFLLGFPDAVRSLSALQVKTGLLGL
jgi:hypothetical protein